MRFLDSSFHLYELSLAKKNKISFCSSRSINTDLESENEQKKDLKKLIFSEK